MFDYLPFAYRIGIDEWLRVANVPDVYAIGDCSGFVESTGKPVLPALAQVSAKQTIASNLEFFALALQFWLPHSQLVIFWIEQVAERQGKYLAGLLNRIGKAGGGRANSGAEVDLGDPFVYKHLGSMATLGRYKALVDLRQSKEGKGISLAGFLSWFIWRSAYLTRVISWRNRFYVAVNWLTTMVFGRDISRI
ncbi:unnamed protein product [Linum tenue]|uniref:NADH:ubiquinone reductase (non-electrogenic) n=1 Tax=Linum tenue TaxID=586396 RepID=A0AAV0I5I2_9ROSI|nr:unnamed protein product [Linum tenue]